MQDRITRRQFIQAGVAGAAALAMGRFAIAAPAKRRPNILIITTDQQRVDAMSASGNRWAKTPAMDSIAAGGVSFMQSYCPYPLCSPSRGSLHTGRTPHELLVDHNSMHIAKGIPLSGQVLREGGYDTGYAGKWHLPASYPADGIAGFEVLNKVGRGGRLARDMDEATLKVATEFLRRQRSKPFLLVASFLNPHDICLLANPNAITDELWKRYGPKDGAELPPLPANHALSLGTPASQARRARHGNWEAQRWRRYRYAYFRMMEDVDRQIGQLLHALRQSGQEEDTLIVFTSDHGEGLGCHGWTGKLHFYDDEAAVPLIVSWKGVIPAGRSDKDHLVTALDVLPTLCDYAGVAAPPVVHGRSLRGVIDDPKSAGSVYVASEMAVGGGRSFMIRTKKYKYMVFHEGAKAEMFFDMDADGGEMKNLSADANLAAEIDRHRKLLAQWCKLTEVEKYPMLPNPKTERPARRAGGRKGA
ncbi:MAG: sulfatase-like hydrolase/transferase [Planctomycetaceae bacterium]|nr:sulfatase-like hydrolase/transferase [Planctomycetaceae bacterium]